MALDGVVKDILASARREADQLLAEAEDERRKMLSEADENISRMRSAKRKELEETLKRLRRREISSAELEAKKTVLYKKKELLDRTFEETCGDLSSMEAGKKAEIYRKVIEANRKVLPRPVVHCPRGEAKLLDGVGDIERVNEADMGAGVVLESPDGAIRLDYRFRTVLEGIWEKELREVSKTLFG